MNSNQEHPLRRQLADELHSRPYFLLPSPSRISHLCAMSGERSDRSDREHLATLCTAFGRPAPGHDDDHFIAPFDRFWVKWERHTEFSTYTVIEEGAVGAPFTETAIRLVPDDWVAGIPGKILTATHVEIEGPGGPEHSIEEIAAFFAGNTITGSHLLNGRARAWTDHRIHDDGYGRVLVRDDGLNQRGLGRLVQRVLEIETYRYAAMLAYPLARSSIPRVAAAEKDLSEIVSQFPTLSLAGDERRLLARLSDLAAEAEAISVSTAYRFSATRAYFGLIQRRVAELREERLEWLQPSGNFLYNRLVPAMETCENMGARQEALSRRIARASDLLRTRVDVALEEQNRDLLESMDRRARLQLRLQETVEGLSVVAISYYLLSLVAYLAKGAKVFGSPADPYLVVLIAFPVVVLSVWGGVRRIRRSITKNEKEEAAPES